MKKLRVPFKTYSFITLAVALAAFLGWEQSHGRFERIDRGFLAWLEANSNQTDTAKPRPVILVRLDDEKRETFEDWPLTRLDYAVVLANLTERQPAVVAVTPALFWPQEDEFGTGLLRSHIESLPHVILGYRLAMGDNRSGIPEFLSPISQVAGDLSGLPAFSTIQFRAEPGLADAASSGFTHPSLLSLPGDPETSIALLAKLGGDVVPSLALQVLAASLGATPDTISVRTGEHSHLKIAGLTLPIDASGGFTLFPGNHPAVMRLDAESLIDAAQAGIVLESLDAAQRSALDQIEDAIVIVGDDSPGARVHPLPGAAPISTADLIARLAAAVLSRGRPSVEWPPAAQYLLWSALVGGGAFLMRFHKRRIVFCAGIALTTYVATALLVYQSSMTWASPVLPLALIAFTALWGAMLPPPKSPRNEKPLPDSESEAV